MAGDKKYDDIKKMLKSMQRVKARDDFESKLFSRLRDIESGKHSASKLKAFPIRTERFGWLTNILKPAYISAVGVTVILLISVVLYVSYLPKKQDVTPVSITQQEQDKNRSDQQITSGELSNSKKESAPESRNEEKRFYEHPVFTPGIEKPSSDFGITKPPLEPSVEIPAPTLRSTEAEPKSSNQDVKDEEKMDGLKLNETKEAPEMKKEKGDERMKKEDVMQKTITPSVEEQNIIKKESGKIDTAKIMDKKVGKKAPNKNDSLQIQSKKKPPVKDEKQPDTSK